jgi:hypothetical protein
VRLLRHSEPEALELEPADAPRGVCPRCSHGSLDAIGPVDRCWLCGGTGWIAAGKPWTDQEREVLRSWWGGVGIVKLAIDLRRPLSELHAEASRLGLPDREPPSFIQLRPVMLKP